MNSPNPTPNDLRALIGIYFGTAAGVLTVTMADILKNGSGIPSHAALFRASDAMKLLFPDGIAVYIQSWLTLLLLMTLGLIFCWVTKPKSIKESFTLGLSIFALLATLAPYETMDNGTQLPEKFKQITSQVGSHWSLVTEAYADNPSQSLQAYYLNFIDSGSIAEGGLVTAKLYDQKESNVIGTFTTKSNGIFELNLQAGEYVMYIECGGCNRDRYVLNVTDAKTQATQIVLKPSSLPLSIQRFYRPSLVQTKKLTAAQMQQIAVQFQQQVAPPK